VYLVVKFSNRTLLNETNPSDFIAAQLGILLTKIKSEWLRLEIYIQREGGGREGNNMLKEYFQESEIEKGQHDKRSRLRSVVLLPPSTLET